LPRGFWTPLKGGDVSHTATRALVIGVGNEARGDDAVGLLAARKINALSLTGVIVLTEQRDGIALITAWQQSGAERVILVDAVSSGAPPGTVRRLHLSADTLPLLDERASTHNIGLAQAVELARILACLPASLILYTVEASQFGLEAALSPEVAQAVDDVVQRIRAEIESAMP